MTALPDPSSSFYTRALKAFSDPIDINLWAQYAQTNAFRIIDGVFIVTQESGGENDDGGPGRSAAGEVPIFAVRVNDDGTFQVGEIITLPPSFNAGLLAPYNSAWRQALTSSTTFVRCGITSNVIYTGLGTCATIEVWNIDPDTLAITAGDSVTDYTLGSTTYGVAAIDIDRAKFVLSAGTGVDNPSAPTLWWGTCLEWDISAGPSSPVVVNSAHSPALIQPGVALDDNNWFGVYQAGPAEGESPYGIVAASDASYVILDGPPILPGTTRPIGYFTAAGTDLIYTYQVSPDDSVEQGARLISIDASAGTYAISGPVLDLPAFDGLDGSASGVDLCTTPGYMSGVITYWDGVIEKTPAIGFRRDVFDDAHTDYASIPDDAIYVPVKILGVIGDLIVCLDYDLDSDFMRFSTWEPSGVITSIASDFDLSRCRFT